VRFAAVDGVLTQGRDLPGRGVYTCLDVACFDEARSRRGFARTLRANVTVGPELARIYTERSNG
jgi:predicted RNA-binding protein YlxR (DUF448 family)